MKDEVLQNKYSLVKGAARRARQLQSGAPPVILSKSMKACRVAQDEIRAGQVSYTLKARDGGELQLDEPKPDERVEL